VTLESAIVEVIAEVLSEDERKAHLPVTAIGKSDAVGLGELCGVSSSGKYGCCGNFAYRFWLQVFIFLLDELLNSPEMGYWSISA
jgi:hypothetical protein